MKKIKLILFLGFGLLASLSWIPSSLAGKGAGVGNCDVWLQEMGQRRNLYDKCDASLKYLRGDKIQVDGSLKSSPGGAANKLFLIYDIRNVSVMMNIGGKQFNFKAGPGFTIRYRVRDAKTNFVEIYIKFNNRFVGPTGIEAGMHLVIEGVATK